MLLILSSITACSKNKADFSLLLARIEQQPETVSEKVIKAIIEKAITTQQKLTLLNLCISYDQHTGHSLLQPHHKNLILKRLLQDTQNETIRYCILSILYDEACIEEVFNQLNVEDISLYPDFCAELFLTYPEKTFNLTKITPDHYASLAVKTNRAELYIFAAVQYILQSDMQRARLVLIQALSNGIRVHPILLWYAGLYDALLELYETSIDSNTLLYVLDAAYQTGQLDLIESCLQKIEHSGHVTKKIKNVYAYYFYKKSQEFAQKNKNMPWTNKYLEEEEYLQKAFNLLRDDIQSCYYAAASYAAVLFHRGNFEAYTQFISNLPDTAEYEYLKFLYSIQFNTGNALKAYLIKTITTSVNEQLVEQALLTLVRLKCWEDFAILYEQLHKNKNTSKFLNFVYYLLKNDSPVPLETCIDLLNMIPESILATITKAQLYLLHDNPKEAEISLENIFKTNIPIQLRKLICDLLIEVEKKLHNEAKLHYYIQKRDEIQYSTTAMNTRK